MTPNTDRPTPRAHRHVYARSKVQAFRWGVEIGQCRYCDTFRVEGRHMDPRDIQERG